MSNIKFKKELDGSINILTSGGVKINGKTLLDIVYPVNSYYISEESTSPAEIFGGTWEQLPEGYTLWSTTTEGEGGKTIDAGLPNITGSVTNVTFRGGVSVTGALTVSGGGNYGHNDGSNNTRRSLNFDASKSNVIYGNSETVQPPAVKVYMWKRIS